MTDKLWKAAERTIGHQLGARRMGPGGDRADLRSEWLCVEVKSRIRLPAWLKAGLGQARHYALPAQLPLLILHENGQPYAAAMVCMTLADFRQWFGGLPGDDTKST